MYDTSNLAAFTEDDVISVLDDAVLLGMEKKPILSFVTGGESYIRMNTEGCTEVIRKGLHFRPDSGMKSSRNSFRMFAREPI